MPLPPLNSVSVFPTSNCKILVCLFKDTFPIFSHCLFYFELHITQGQLEFSLCLSHRLFYRLLGLYPDGQVVPSRLSDGGASLLLRCGARFTSRLPCCSSVYYCFFLLPLTRSLLLVCLALLTSCPKLQSCLPYFQDWCSPGISSIPTLTWLFLSISSFLLTVLASTRPVIRASPSAASSPHSFTKLPCFLLGPLVSSLLSQCGRNTYLYRSELF